MKKEPNKRDLFITFVLCLCVVLIIVFFVLPPETKSSGYGGTFPQGDNIRALKDNLIFKTDAKIMTGDADNPSIVSKDAKTGSLYIPSGGGLYQKTDDGTTTNWNDLTLDKDSSFNFPFEYYNGKAEDNDVVDWTSRTPVGTLSKSETVTEFYDEVNDKAVWKWVAVAGNETGEERCIPNIALPKGTGNRDLLIQGWFWTDISSEKLEWKLYQGGTTTEIEPQSDVFFVYKTDADDDSVYDADEGGRLGKASELDTTGDGLAFSIPNGVTSVDFCFHVLSDVPTGEYLLLNHFKVGEKPLNVVATIEEATYETKFLSANKTSNGNMPDLTFNNLEVGQRYRLGGQCVNGQSAVGVARSYCSVYHNGTLIHNIGAIRDTAGSIGGVSIPFHTTFIAESTTLTVDAGGIVGGGIIEGNGTITATHIILEKIPTQNKAFLTTAIEKNRAGFFGGVNWQSTSSCSWVLGGTLVDIPADAECDDNARVILGEYNITSGAIGHADGRQPLIRFSKMPKGDYLFRIRGVFHQDSTADKTCLYRLSDGIKVSDQVKFHSTQDEYEIAEISFRMRYDSAQTNKVFNLQGSKQSGASACILSNTDGTPLAIDVYFYPDYAESLKSIVSVPVVEYDWENEFSATISANCGAVLTSKGDWIQSVSKPSDRRCNITLKSGLFTQAPIAVVSTLNTVSDCNVGIASSSTATIQTLQQTTCNEAISIKVSRQGTDYRKRGSVAAIISQPTCIVNPRSGLFVRDSITATTSYKKRNVDSLLGDCTNITADTVNNRLTLKKGTYIIDATVGCYDRTNQISLGIYNFDTSSYITQALHVLTCPTTVINNADVAMVPIYIDLEEDTTLETHTKSENANGFEILGRIKITRKK